MLEDARVKRRTSKVLLAKKLAHALNAGDLVIEPRPGEVKAASTDLTSGANLI